MRQGWMAILVVGAVFWGATYAEAGISFLNAWGSSGSGDGQFAGPAGLATAPDGSVYVADEYNNRIQKFTHTGGFVTTWGSYGVAPGQFKQPTGVGVASTGHVYVPDRGNNRVQIFTSSGTYGGQFNGAGNPGGQFSGPWGLTFGPDGSSYVVDTGNGQIQKFTSYNTYVTHWDGGAAGALYNPFDAAVSPDGNHVYVADAFNNRIVKYTTTGTYVTQWGGFGTADGQFKRAYGVAVNAAGEVYATDFEGGRVQKFTSDGTFIESYDTGLTRPYGIEVAPTGEVYVSDFGSRSVQRLFDVTAWASGTNSFTDAGTGPTDVAVGTDQLLGQLLELDGSRGLTVGGATTVQDGGTLSLAGGSFCTGDLMLSELATLEMDLSSGSGPCDVTNSLLADGTLYVTANGMTFSVGDTFELFDAGTMGGAFDVMTLPALASDMRWDTSSLYSTGTISVAARAVPVPGSLALAMLGLIALNRFRKR